MTGVYREMVATRVFDAPRALVWKVWTEPAHIAEWWGPRSFSSTIDRLGEHLAKVS